MVMNRSLVSSWRGLLQATALMSVVISIFGAVAFGPEIPVVIGLLTGIGLLWLRRPGKGGVIYTGLIHVLIGIVVLVLFQNLMELAYPASWMVFVSTGARLIATLVAIVAALAALTSSSAERAPRAIGALALTALLLVIALGVVSRLSVTSDLQQARDVVLRITPETTWSARELRVPAGRISIYVENDDVHHGNFTIDGVVNVQIPSGTSKRATFELEPGQYRFYSKLYRGEPEMQGTFIVS